MHWLGSQELFEFYLDELMRISRTDAHLVITMPTEDHFLFSGAIEQASNKFQAQAPEQKDCVFLFTEPTYPDPPI